MHREIREIREIRESRFLPDLLVHSDGGLKRAAASCGNRCGAGAGSEDPTSLRLCRQNDSFTASCMMRGSAAPIGSPNAAIRLSVAPVALYRFSFTRLKLSWLRMLNASQMSVSRVLRPKTMSRATRGSIEACAGYRYWLRVVPGAMSLNRLLSRLISVLT